MSETLTSPLVDAAVESFESLAFFFAETVSSDGPVPGEADGVTAVSFSGPSRGALVLQLSGGVLPALAGNMLGLEESPSAEDQRDALGETANVICGNVLPRLAGSTAVFALTPPTRFESWDAAIAAYGIPAAHVVFEVEGGRADLALMLAPDAA